MGKLMLLFVIVATGVLTVVAFLAAPPYNGSGEWDRNDPFPEPKRRPNAERD